MNSPVTVVLLALPAFAWAALQVLYFWPRLPDRIASHFDFRLEPDATMRKGTFMVLYAAMMVGTGVLALVFTPFLLPALYLLPAVFHFVFDFSARPGQTHLSMWFWAILAAFLIGTMYLTSFLQAPGS